MDDLAALRMGVRVDLEGVPMRDFQTAGGDRDPDKKTLLIATGKAVNRTAVSPRHYLADAPFLVALEGARCSLLAADSSGPAAPRLAGLWAAKHLRRGAP